MISSSTIAANPSLPFVGNLPGGFTQGSSLNIDACMNHGSPRFNVNIQDTAGSDRFVPLHLSFRSNESCIVRNHKTNGSWGVEERAGGIPVRPGQHFRLTITAEATGFTILIDGVRFTSFNYRLGLEKAQFVSVHGDVSVFNIVFANNHGHGVPPIAVCPPVHPNHPVQPIQPPFQPIQPPFQPGGHHHHHGHHHGNCQKPPKKDKKCKKDKKQKKKDKKRRGSCSSSSSSSSSD